MTRQGAAVLIADERGRVLLIHEDYGRHRWGLPGGRHEPGESIEETAIREAKEETNLDVELGELIGEYMIVSASGQELLDVSVFIATIAGGELAPNEGEIAEVGWFDPNDLPIVSLAITSTTLTVPQLTQLSDQQIGGELRAVAGGGS